MEHRPEVLVKDCRYGCGALIHFEDHVVSSNGRKIPLEGDNTPHNCPFSLYNERKSQHNLSSSSSSRIDEIELIGNNAIPILPPAPTHSDTTKKKSDSDLGLSKTEAARYHADLSDQIKALQRAICNNRKEVSHYHEQVVELQKRFNHFLMSVTAGEKKDVGRAVNKEK
jgi:hypothetical protein